MIHPSLIPITLATLLMTGAAQAQSASFTGSGFTENFNSMGTAGTTRPTGWTTWNGASGSGNGTWTTSITANGATNSVASMVSITAALTASSAPTANNNNGYNAQSGTAADRAMATAPTGNSGTASQLAIVNNSAVDLASIQIAYDIRRYTAPATVNELPGYWLFYSLDGTTWTNVAALNPTVSGTSGVIVPNSVGVTSVATTTVNLSSAWTVGSTLRFRWIDDNAVATSPDQVFGLDNVVISLAQAAPTVSLTAPANASTNVLPAAVNLVADAADANGSVAKVEFFQGVTKLGEVVNPGPFQFSWSGMLSGSYVLTARATDNDGAATTSAPVSITVTNPNNLAPAVAISSPANDATVPAASLVIDANASDPDGLISKVEFYNGSTLLGKDTSAPFSHTISSVAVGTYALTAVATDNDGAVTTSAVVNVNTVTFTDSTTIPRGAAWKFLDDGSDQGTAWKETAFDDTAWIAGTAELGYADSPVTALAQSATTGGPKFITYYFRRHFSIADAAQVIGLRTNLERDDGAIIYLNGSEVARSNMNSGAVDYLTQSATIVSNADETTYFPITLPASSLVSGDNVIAVSIHQRDNTSSDLSFDLDLITTTAGGNALPVVQLTAPANGSTVNVGNPIAITANATDDYGSVQKVEFFQGTTKLGEDLVSPYEFTWSGAATGTHSLTAVATDDLGGTSTSAAITLTVATGPSGNLTRGPYLNMANQNSIVVRWRGSQSIIGRVRYGLAPDALTQSTDESSAQTDHVVRLTGLTPYTRYYYSVGSAVDSLTPQAAETTSFTPGAPAPTAADYSFRTSPLPGTAVDTRIWIVGDCGRGTQTQADGTLAYRNFTGSRIPDLNLQMGDNAYNSGTDSEYQTGYYNMYHNMFRKMPQWSTLGNHDASNGQTGPTLNHPYFDMFTFPTAGECGGVASGTEHYYSFDYGNIHFICLDSQASVTTVDNPATTGVNEDGPMAAWVRQDLASTTSTWIIAFWHHPPYSKGSHDSDTEAQMVNMRSRFNPIMEQGGVDLVFLGHSHNYERSVLLDGHYGTSGTITSAMKKNAGNGSVSGFTTSASGKIRNAANSFTATATIAGTVIPPDGAYLKPLTGPRDHFGTVYNTAGMSGQADGGGLDHSAMYISYNNVGTVNLDVNGTTLKATFVQSGGATPDNFTITKQGAADTDSDGISDAFEIANGLSRYANDAAASADSDGLSNLLEFAFGLNPNVNDSGLLEANVPGALLTKRGTPAPWYQSTTNGTDFRVIYIRRKDAAEAGLVYTPQFSGDLVTWADSSVTPTVIADGGEVEAVSINYPFFVAGRKARFFRVGVSTNH